MKRLISLILILALALCFFGCKDSEYAPVQSTAEESRVLMRVRYESSTFDVRYELYRAFYLTFRTEYPESLSEDDRAELEERVLNRIYHVYSTLSLCESLGMSIYDTAVEDKIKEFIKISVEGGYIDSTRIEGHESYEDYLASLRELNMNYAVQELIFRYGIAKNLIYEHFRSESGIYEDITREDAKTFYEREDTGRYLTLYLDAALFSAERAEQIAATLATLEGEDAVFAKMVNYSTLNLQELRAGQIITPNNLDSLTYAPLTEAAAHLSVGEVSAPIHLANNTNNGYMILYKAEKSDAHFDANVDQILEELMNDRAGARLSEVYASMKESITLYPLYETLDRDSIRMD